VVVLNGNSNESKSGLEDARPVHSDHSKLPEFMSRGLQRVMKNNKDNEISAIDIVSRVAFPATFILFNFVYWIGYLTSAGP